MYTFLKYAQHFCTPHASNNHRARILHPPMLLVVIVLIFTIQMTFRLIHETRPDILGFATNITLDELLVYTNQKRAQEGLSILTANTVLSRAAEKKAQDMFSDGYWAHNAPDGTTPWDFITGEGYRYTYAGENLARDFSNSIDVVDAWMASPSHRDNMLRSEYQEIGFAVLNGTLNGRETTLVVQMFGTQRSPFVAPVSQDSPPIVNVNAPMAPQVHANSTEQMGISVRRHPIFNMRSMQQMVIFVLLGVFGSVLIIDGYMIWKHKTVRVAGHNMAHLIFIAMIAGIVILGASGTVL